MTKVKVRSWMNRPKVWDGEPKPKKISMTVPGQAVTPADIVRTMTAGVMPPQVFLGNSVLSEWDKMDIFERTEHLKKLAEVNKQAKDEILFAAEKLKKRAEAQKYIDEYEKTKAQNAQNATTTNDDAK